ncbi:MAG: GTPase ObgE [Clostridia bacterium]
MFIDSARILLKAGKGGDGCVAFHREKYITSGGPDGGDGGKGGDVIVEVDEGGHTLADFRYQKHYKAGDGENGRGGNCSGHGGGDLIIKVPPGTMIRDEATDQILADMVTPGQRQVICRGGKGGKGNQHFATPTRQIPMFAKVGGLAEERRVRLELKLLADVGLVGFPNVGKSTILSMVTSATPKIADYHFTTIDPNLGVVKMDYAKSFVIADIPGIIEGAHEGVGLGHEFLKHIERTKLLVHVVDVSGHEGRDPIMDFDIINSELRQYNEKLATRPQIVVANKMDITGAEENFELFKAEMESRGLEVFQISAATNQGLRELMLKIAEILETLPDTIVGDAPDEVVLYQAKEEKPFEIKVVDGVYYVEGPWMYKVIGSSNFTNYDSLQYFQRAIKSKGVYEALEAAGCQEGDTVNIYGTEFDYVK